VVGEVAVPDGDLVADRRVPVVLRVHREGVGPAGRQRQLVASGVGSGVDGQLGLPVDADRGVQGPALTGPVRDPAADDDRVQRRQPHRVGRGGAGGDADLGGLRLVAERGHADLVRPGWQRQPVRAVVAPRALPATGARSSSASASSLPSPYTLLSPGVPPHCGSGVSTALASSIALVWSTSPTRSGAADHSSATAAATCGAAIEVPSPSAYRSPGTAERTATPGAEMSGLTRPSSPPRLEKSAIRPSGPYAPTE